MVTAELAVALPAVVLVLATCLLGLGAVVDQVRCTEAARVAARAAARGDEAGRVRSLAVSAAPPGARVSVSAGGGEAVVRVEVESGGWGLLPSFSVSSTARVPVERSAEQAGAP